MTSMRELLPHGGVRKQRSAAEIAMAAGTGFDYPAKEVGVAGNVSVYYDPGLGTAGSDLAKQLLGAVSGPYQDMQAFFGITGGAVSVVIAPLSGKNDGSGGARHYGCNFSSGGILYIDATFANATVNPLSLGIGLYVAELSESFMGPQGRQWNCGYSNGEALSRFCAEHETPPGTMAAFSTGPAWDRAGRPDWIDRTEDTDQDPVSTGCGVVYLHWLRSLGFSIPQIVQGGGATLSTNYEALTGKKTAYSDLTSALRGRAINSDDPFDSSS